MPRVALFAARGTNTHTMIVLVDDRDGRILAEAETAADVRRVLEAWIRDDGSIPAYVCLVEVRSHDGAFFATDTSVKIQPLSRAAL